MLCFYSHLKLAGCVNFECVILSQELQVLCTWWHYVEYVKIVAFIFIGGSFRSSFHQMFFHVISLPCIYWRKIIIFLVINFHFHQWNSLQTFFGIVWQLCYGMPIQTFFFLNKPDLTCQISWCEFAFVYFIECECGARASVSTIFSYHPPLEILRDSSYQFSYLHCSRSHLPHSGNGFVPPDLNGPELQHNLLASLLFLEYLESYGARLGSEWFILE